MITLKFQNAMSAHAGASGITDAELAKLVKAARRPCADVVRRRKRLGFTDLPYREEVISKVAAAGRRIRGRYRNFVQLGIGGSSLGAAALCTALLDRFHNERRRPRMYFLDNVDPEETASLFEHLDPAETLFHVVTKSGETTETVAGFLVAVDRLRKRGLDLRRHLAITTDRRKGFLRRFATQERLRTFEVPESVGGRFSVLTPVGLLPAAAAGLPIRELAAGAILADELCARKDPARNPACLLALLAHHFQAKRARPIHVLMPYSRALRDVGDWFRQLWAESLGKRLALDGREVFTGPTPVLALGATDQHSQVQLYAEGPQDKLVVFLTAEKFRRDLEIPASVDDPSAGFLHGRRFADVLAAEQRGTADALARAGRPNLELSLAEISPRTVGGLLFLLEMATVFAGRFYGVDPFDQPGVEAGKQAAFALLGRDGYRDRRAAIEERTAPDPRYLVR